MIRSYVVEGATLKCSCGSQTSKLKLPRNSKITINQIKQATVADYHANGSVNVQSYRLMAMIIGTAVLPSV
jgi:hypothetical protein